MAVLAIISVNSNGQSISILDPELRYKKKALKFTQNNPTEDNGHSSKALMKKVDIEDGLGKSPKQYKETSVQCLVYENAYRCGDKKESPSIKDCRSNNLVCLVKSHLLKIKETITIWIKNEKKEHTENACIEICFLNISQRLNEYDEAICLVDRSTYLLTDFQFIQNSTLPISTLAIGLTHT